MQIVIDIPEGLKDVFEHRNVTALDVEMMRKAIKNGTPLPKGHGRLIDADALNTKMEQRMGEIGDDESIWESSNVATALEMFAPTIIPAESEVNADEDSN